MLQIPPKSGAKRHGAGLRRHNASLKFVRRLSLFVRSRCMATFIMGMGCLQQCEPTDNLRPPQMKATKRMAKYPGIPSVIHGNGAVAHVMGHVCGGVIGYPITPSTEISEIYESVRADGGVNIWGRHPFFFSPEGEHSAQSGALGASLTGGQFISNASSSQGILYGLESHYVTVGKKVGGFVLQVAARVVSKHSLNVMAGHDDVYALLSSGYTILFGANPQEAADLAAISYRVSSLALFPVANAMDGFATSHMLSEALLPESELLKEYLGDPGGRIKAPTLAQEMVFGSKGRVFQLQNYLSRHKAEIEPANLALAQSYLAANAAAIEKDNDGALVAKTFGWMPRELHGPWRRQWQNAHEKGTRQRVPALVDSHNPGLTGAVQNQPDFQAGAVDHRTHFANAVPGFVRQAMDEYAELTGRRYSPVHTFMCDDAETVMVGLGSVTDDVEAVVSYLRGKGQKVGLVAIKLLQPFPEAELVAALAGKKAVTVLERCDQTALTTMVTQALFKARENAEQSRHADIPALSVVPTVTTAIFGLGGHDLQPRHLIAAFKSMAAGASAPLIYLGSQFFAKNPTPRVAELQARLKQAYPETERMALETEENPRLLPDAAFRVRFHSVGGYGTIASGKLLTDILAGVLGMHSKSAPKYGSEKSGAPTNYYITLSPEPIKITNADLEDVEIVISPDHKVFSHTNPLLGLAQGGTFILQTSATAEQVWQEMPAAARKTIRDRKIGFFIIDAFSVAKKHAPTPELEIRMMGIAFIGAIAGHVARVSAGASAEVILEKIRQQISKKFGAKGGDVVVGNMAVIREGIEATRRVDYESAAFASVEARPVTIPIRSVALSASMCGSSGTAACGGLFDREYYDDMIASQFREGTMSEAPVLPGTGLFMPPGTAAAKDKGLFRRTVPEFLADVCTGCMECAVVCPDGAIPNTVHDISDLLATAIRQIDVSAAQREALQERVAALAGLVRETYSQSKHPRPLHEIVADAASRLETENPAVLRDFGKVAAVLAVYPVAKSRLFFDVMEKEQAGSGGLFSVSVDPWKCTGCQECVDACGPGALVTREQDAALLETIQARFEFLTKTANTPARFTEDAIRPGGKIKYLLLDRANYYATTGGHGACRGCGEVTAIRLVMATNRAITDQRKRDHIRDLEGLLGRLAIKQATLGDKEGVRRLRIGKVIALLEKRLYYYESGPTGNGPCGAVIANSTGCSSVYASSFPFNCYNDPWVNSLFQDAQPLAKGIFEGISAHTAGDVRALRMARLELDDAYEPEKHEAVLRHLQWNQFTVEELGLMPTVMTIGGDGATYDIGFGALSRILVTDTPIKIMVLNTGVYSNTGGQASTASFLGQDSDLARIGTAYPGKHEHRKEFGLLASFHPNVFVVSTSAALQGHFLKNTMEFLNYTDSPAVMDVYTPCQPEHGIADDASDSHARLAVRSRMNPVFVHDPRRGNTLHDWFVLDGNPDPEKTWTTMSLEYKDEAGKQKKLQMTLTPAHFALGENRFKKHFRRLDPADVEVVPIEDFINLSKTDRKGRTPYIWTTDTNQRLVRLSVSGVVIELVEERRKYWQMLQYLGGQNVAARDASHLASMEAIQAEYRKLVESRDSTLDLIARAMSELGTVKLPPAAAADREPLVTYAIEDRAKCTNCKICYQDLSELFEKTMIEVDGVSKEVGQLIPGVLDRVESSPELKLRIRRVAASCEGEIIR